MLISRKSPWILPPISKKFLILKIQNYTSTRTEVLWYDVVWNWQPICSCTGGKDKRLISAQISRTDRYTSTAGGLPRLITILKYRQGFVYSKPRKVVLTCYNASAGMTPLAHAPVATASHPQQSSSQYHNWACP